MAEPWRYSENSSDRSRRDAPRKRLRGRDLIARAAVAELLRQTTGRGLFEAVENVVTRHYDGCPATLAYIQRAATAPANSTTATWAAELVGSSIADFLVDMERKSAFAALAAQAVSLTLPPGAGSIRIPSRASPLVLAGAWIAEAGPKPVAAISLAKTDLVQFKLSAVSVFSEELLLHSTPSIEVVVTEALRHDLGALLDTALLDSTAASAVRPAGLFAGVTPITASTATPTSEAMAKDLGALAGAVSSGNPDSRPVFLASATQHARMVAAGYQAIRTGFLAANSVACVDGASLAMTASSAGVPRVEFGCNPHGQRAERAVDNRHTKRCRGADLVDVSNRQHRDQEHAESRLGATAQRLHRDRGVRDMVTVERSLGALMRDDDDDVSAPDEIAERYAWQPGEREQIEREMAEREQRICRDEMLEWCRQRAEAREPEVLKRTASMGSGEKKELIAWLAMHARDVARAEVRALTAQLADAIGKALAEERAKHRELVTRMMATTEQRAAPDNGVVFDLVAERKSRNAA